MDRTISTAKPSDESKDKQQCSLISTISAVCDQNVASLNAFMAHPYIFGSSGFLKVNSICVGLLYLGMTWLITSLLPTPIPCGAIHFWKYACRCHELLT